LLRDEQPPRPITEPPAPCSQPFANKNRISYALLFTGFSYIWRLCLTKNHKVMSHEKAKEQTKVKKQATKSLKEKRAEKKAKKAEKSK